MDGDSVIEFIDHPELFNIDEDPGKRTALHLAVTNRHPKVIDVLLDYKGMMLSSNLIPNVKDKHHICFVNNRKSPFLERPHPKH